jgi:hypothetical protein
MAFRKEGYNMKKSIGWLHLAVFAGWALMGCADSGAGQNEVKGEVGKLAFPLITNGPSGAQYQLRNASFQIQSYRYYDDYGTGGYYGTAIGRGGAYGTTAPAPIVVSSETNPSAPSIEVDLEEGDYRVTLLPGWSLESLVDGVATPVPEVQLISSEAQWVWVSPHSTSWVTYQFGIGDRSLWFNGKLNVDIRVYETPEDYYGPSYGGSAGGTWGPAGGMPTTAAGGAIAAGGSFGG